MARVTVFNPKRLPDCAKRFLADVPITHYRGRFYLWRTGVYEEVSHEFVAKKIIDVFSKVKVRYLDKVANKFKTRPYDPTGHWARELRTYLAGDDAKTPPSWLAQSPYPAHEILPVQNGLLHIPQRELLQNSRYFFTTGKSRAAFELCGLREAPSFTKFLTDIWGSFDAPEVRFLQDLLGYLLTADPPGQELQKFFLFRGAPRGGKGTVVKIIQALVGDGVCATIAANDVGKNTFAFAPLVDKRIGLLGDLRLADDKDLGRKLLPEILKVAGGDEVPINRKHKDQIDIRLNTKLILETNTDLGIHDTTGALASRALPLIFPRSFVGREDPGLAHRIITQELQAVLCWALDGWDRVDARRRAKRPFFELPQTSTREIEELLRQSSVILEFLGRLCKREGSVAMDVLYKAWAKWAKTCRVLVRDRDWLRAEVRAAWPTVTTRTEKPYGDRRVLYLDGISLV